MDGQKNGMSAKDMAAEVLEALKAHIEHALTPLKRELTAVSEKLEQFPIPKDGERGEKGDTGEKGERGETGLTGKDGDPGKDGEPGQRGERGERGESGEPGLNGKDGSDGLAGKDGADGRDGRDGIDGRDAAQLDPIPSIDPDKSYPRGTWASHRGGLVKATRTTTPFAADDCGDFSRAGWVVMVEGLAECEALQEGERTFGHALTNTSGKTTKALVSIPVVIDRGVYKSESEYVRGDGVTCGGSFWICQKDNPDGRPDGGNAAWRLAVKRGRDGRDSDKRP